MISLIKATIDASVYSGLPTHNYGGADRLGLASTSQRAFIFFARPFPVGAVVVYAKLRVWVRSFPSGPRVLSVQRVTGAWREDQITWANQPGVAGAAASSGSIPTAGAGYMIEIDVTGIMQAVAAGSVYQGLRIVEDSAVYATLNSAEAGAAAYHPELEVSWTSVPTAPTDMKPSGGRLVSIAQPTFTWHFNDADGDEQSAYRVEIANDGVFSSMLRDTGWVAAAEQDYTLESASLVDGNTYYWRVTTRDSQGAQSPVSDVQQFGRDSKGSLAIVSPGATVPETTPPIAHTFSGETQTAVQRLLYGQDAGSTIWELLYDSGRQATTSTSQSLPAGLITAEDATYRVVVRVWDAKAREGTPGDPTYVEAQQDFTYVPDGTPDPPTNLAVTQDSSPSYLLSWERSSTPDYFALKADNKIFDARIDPEAVRVDATHYLMRVWELTPGVAHTLEIQAVVLDAGVLKHSTPNPHVSAVLKARDAWIIMPSKNIYVPLFLEAPPSYGYGEDGTTFFPRSRRDPVRIVGAIRGQEGTITGVIGPGGGKTGPQNRAAFEEIKSWHRRGERVVLITGDRQFGVLLGAASAVAQPGTDNEWFTASVEFWQIDGFTIRDR